MLKILKIIASATLLTYLCLYFAFPYLPITTNLHFYLFVVLTIIVSLLISLVLSRLLDLLVNTAVKSYASLNARELAVGAAGAAIAAMVAFFVVSPLSNTLVGSAIAMLITAVCAASGFAVGMKRSAEFSFTPAAHSERKTGRPKILDTSVIIDGRILDILKTGFIEGRIIIPGFILEELRHIADSSDALKRNRGRTGLDILNQIRALAGFEVEILDWMPEDNAITEVDALLIKLAQKIDAHIVTNDQNLMKIAELHKVQAISVNALSNAVKSMVLPGQEMNVFIVKEGKEPNQGVAYLNDGTMIVVEDGRKYLEHEVDIIVTSVLQTPAGRMVFGKYKEGQPI